MTATLQRGLDALYLACIWIAGASVFFMSLIIPVGVFARYVLGFGAQWPEPIAILLMVTFTFFGAAAAYRAGAHIAVAMLTDRLPGTLQRASVKLVQLLMAALSLFMLVWGTRLCLDTMGQTLASLPWMPVGLTYAPVPLGALCTLAFVLETLALGPQHARPVVRYEHADADAQAQGGAAAGLS